MANLTVTKISYNYEALYVEGKEVEKILRDITYEFTASNNELKLEGKMTSENELTRQEAEQKIKDLLKE